MRNLQELFRGRRKGEGLRVATVEELGIINPSQWELRADYDAPPGSHQPLKHFLKPEVTEAIRERGGPDIPIDAATVAERVFDTPAGVKTTIRLVTAYPDSFLGDVTLFQVDRRRTAIKRRTAGHAFGPNFRTAEDAWSFLKEHYPNFE